MGGFSPQEFAWSLQELQKAFKGGGSSLRGLKRLQGPAQPWKLTSMLPQRLLLAAQGIEAGQEDQAEGEEQHLGRGQRGHQTAPAMAKTCPLLPCTSPFWQTGGAQGKAGKRAGGPETHQDAGTGRGRLGGGVLDKRLQLPQLLKQGPATEQG